MAKFGNVESGSAAEAAVAWVRQFAIINPITGEVIAPPDIETVRTAALAAIRERADTLLAATDDGIIGNDYVQDEARRYAEAGRPADPAASQYLIASEIATNRGVTLRVVLEEMRSRYISRYQSARTVIGQLDALTRAVGSAATVAEIEAALAGIGA